MNKQYIIPQGFVLVTLLISVTLVVATIARDILHWMPDHRPR
jgi:hypothetical protein